ncbi:endonuclease [Ferrimonas pelagia]|uniref:Endonuclease III domain-containing protein n=1 Tax=Ferrimonas pelagia TaxID=1177826 RepID=A0ABP9FIM4_9GAMM
MLNINPAYPSANALVEDVFRRLKAHFGCFEWWLNAPAYEVMLGAVLVQNTNWRNADKALINLAEHRDPAAIARLPLAALAALIRPSGYYNQKAAKLKALTRWYARYGYELARVQRVDLTVLRQELLAIKGIGPETADAILVYAIGKPSFVIDAYARRLFSRNGLTVPKDYHRFQALIEAAIPRDNAVYAYYHGLIVEHGQAYCRPTPRCDACPLRSTCLGPE